jgi:hypothetical protein
MADLKRYFGNLKDALLGRNWGRDEFAELEGGIPFRVGPGSEDRWPVAGLQVHWHPPLAAAQVTEPMEDVETMGRFRSWIERKGFWRQSA